MLEVFKGIVQMAFNCGVAGLKFDGDFKLGNFCFNGKTRTWYMIDVEEFVAINPDSSFRRCWQKVVRGRRQSEVVDRQRALSEFYRLLDEHVTSFHPDCPDEHGLEKTLPLHRKRRTAAKDKCTLNLHHKQVRGNEKMSAFLGLESSAH